MLVAGFACSKADKSKGENSLSGIEAGLLNSGSGEKLNPGYYHLTGTLGDMPVVMDLVIDQEMDGFRQIHASYYYERYQQPIDLSCSEEAHVLKLEEFVPNVEKSNLMELSVTASGELSGKWTGKDKTLPVKLSAGANDGSRRLTVWTKQDSLVGTYQGAHYGVATFNQSWLVTEDAAIQEFLLKSQAEMQLPDKEKPSADYQQVYARARAAFFKDYQATLAELAPENSDLEVNYADSWTVMPLYNTRELLTLAYDEYDYTGGAHGNYGTRLASYDLVKMQKLTLADLFEPGYERLLKVLLEKKIRERFQLAEDAALTDGLLVESIELTDNFGITGKGILFVYNPYEIAAYVYGEIPVFITFQEMKAYARTHLLSQN